MAAQEMTERMRKLGPNPLKNGKAKPAMENPPAEEEAGFRGRR
jgi:hypothetical protein